MWNDFYPATKWHDIGEGVRWRLHKHWGTNVWAGETLTDKAGDRSGCLLDCYIRSAQGEYIPMKACLPPFVVEQRIYQKEDKQLSAVLSYPFPRGIGAESRYFWEIYPVDSDIERFFDEEEMEQRVIQLLLKGG